MLPFKNSNSREPLVGYVIEKHNVMRSTKRYEVKVKTKRK